MSLKRTVREESESPEHLHPIVRFVGGSLDALNVPFPDFAAAMDEEHFTRGGKSKKPMSTEAVAKVIAKATSELQKISGLQKKLLFSMISELPHAEDNTSSSEDDEDESGDDESTPSATQPEQSEDEEYEDEDEEGDEESEQDEDQIDDEVGTSSEEESMPKKRVVLPFTQK